MCSLIARQQKAEKEEEKGEAWWKQYNIKKGKKDENGDGDNGSEYNEDDNDDTGDGN